MDPGQPLQAGLPRDLESPSRGTRTLAVREYEETISKLKQENFDLKLRIYLFDESNKKYGNSKGSSAEENDAVEIFVNLKAETEALRNDLGEKNRLLQEALENAEKYASELTELQDKFNWQQKQLEELSDLPTEQEIAMVNVQINDLVKEIERLTALLHGKDEELKNTTLHLKELSEENIALKKKSDSSSKAIQGLVARYNKDICQIPEVLYGDIKAAVSAAKGNKEDAMLASVENLISSLRQMMPSNTEDPSGEKRNKENLKPKDVSSILGYSLNENRRKSDNMLNESAETAKVMEENRNLKLRVDDYLKSIESLSSVCSVMKRKNHELENALLKSKSDNELSTKHQKSKYVGSPTAGASKDYLHPDMCELLMETAGRSDNIKQLKDDIFMLMLIVNQKDEEISHTAQELASLQEHMKLGLSQNISSFMHEDYASERRELHDRLARSCDANSQLLTHLKNLGKFLEDLLQHRNLDGSTIEDVEENSVFIDKITKCYDESLKLSHVLSDNLTICESSKIFDVEDDLSTKDASQLGKSFHPAESPTSPKSPGAADLNASSSEPSKSFLCKKCKTHSALSEDLSENAQQSSQNLNEKYKAQENIAELKENLQKNQKIIESLKAEKLELLQNIEQLNSDLMQMKEREGAIIVKTKQSMTRLSDSNKKNFSMEGDIRLLEKKLTDSDEMCHQLKTELEQTKLKLKELDKRCSRSEDMLSQKCEVEKKCVENLKQVENEKSKLQLEVEQLMMTKSDLLKKLNTETEDTKLLEEENIQLSYQLEKNIKEMNLLRSSNQELQDAKNVWLKEKKSAEVDMQSSSAFCKTLQNDIEELKIKLRDLESKCNMYKEEALKLSEEKHNVAEQMSKVKSDFGMSLGILGKVVHPSSSLRRSSLEKSVDSSSDLESICNSIVSDNFKFKQMINTLIQELQNAQAKFQQQNLHAEELEERNRNLLSAMQELKEKEQESETNNRKISSLQLKVNSLEQQAKESSEALNKREDEITASHEKIFNLNSQIDSIISEKNPDMDVSFSQSGSSLNKSHDSYSSVKLEQYIKKINVLKTKLALSESRIEALEKEKESLRQDLKCQVSLNGKKGHYSQEVEKLNSIIEKLKAEIEEKRAFNASLKQELYETHNKQFESQREIDNLKANLSELTKNENRRYKDRLSDAFPTQLANLNISEMQTQKKILLRSIVSVMEDFLGRGTNHTDVLEKLKRCCNKYSTSKEFLSRSMNTDSTVNKLSCDKATENLQSELECDVEFLMTFQKFVKTCLPSISHLKNQRMEFQDEETKIMLDNTFPDNNEDLRHGSPFPEKLIDAVASISRKLDRAEKYIRSIANNLQVVTSCETLVGGTPRKAATKSILDRLLRKVGQLHEKSLEISRLNLSLKSLKLFPTDPPKTKHDSSDRESILSEETTFLFSRSISPISFEEQLTKDHTLTKDTLKLNQSRKSAVASGSQESVFHRSHYSSPDLGIESDANHESSAPEQGEQKDTFGGLRMMKESRIEQQKFEAHLRADGTHPQTPYPVHAIGDLNDYLLLKKEVEESLVAIRSILTRTGDGLRHIGKHASPRKTLENETMRAIKDSAVNLQVCLKTAHKLICKFKTAPCASEEELNRLLKLIKEQEESLWKIHDSNKKQEIEFKGAMEQLKQANLLREKEDKKISKKLVKTKNVIRMMEQQFLERTEGHPPLPRHPANHSIP